MNKLQIFLALAISYSCLQDSFGQVISRPTPDVVVNAWPAINIADWPETLAQSYRYAAILEGDDGRQEALFAEIAKALTQAGKMEQSTAVIFSLKGVCKGKTAAIVAAELWAENSTDSPLAQKLFDLAAATAPTLAPAQQQYLYAELAIASAASPKQQHNHWLDKIYDEEVRQSAVGGCYIRTLRRAKTVSIDDFKVWLNLSEQLKSPISKLHQAEGLLSVADALHSLIPPSRMTNDDLVFLCRKAVELAQQSGVPDVETIVRATEIMLAHKANTEIEVYFKRSTKKVLSLPLSFDKRPNMLMRLSSIARALGNAEQAEKFQADAIIGSGQVEAVLRGTVSLDVCKLLIKEGHREKAMQLVSAAAERIAVNENINLRLEFLSRLYLDLFELKLVLPFEVLNSLSKLKENN